MPMASDYSNHGRMVRALIYGPDKTKKTWWACRAAEAGYNVILIDGDDGSSITKQLPPAAQERILVVDVVNTQKRAVFARFMASFCRPGNAFLWDEQEKVSISEKTKLNPDHSYVRFEPSKFTSNDVVVIDSWTALAASSQIEWANDQNVDLTAVEKEGDQFSLLNFQARILDYVLNQIHTMPCHVIVVGHETVYEKFKTDSNGKRVIVSSDTIPISSTGPQGKKLGKHFNDVLRFYKLNDTAYRIDSAGGANIAGGSRLLPPKQYKWEEVTPQLLFEAVGAKADPHSKFDSAGAVWIKPGETIAQIPVNQTGITPAAPSSPGTTSQVLNAGDAPQSKLSLLRKKT